MKQTQRHDAIIELVKKQGYVSTEELVEQFAVSPQTIRRDLNDLADQKMILRHHGGAALPSSSVNTSWHDKATQTAGKRAYRPQGGQPDPRRRDAVYRYRHHAGSGGARAAGS
jgi:DeoR/GlpR family transcriptional regulator of sugar metabolism